MPKEIELKLQLAKTDVECFMALECIKPFKCHSYVLKNTYFDTQDAILAQHKIALRIRQKGDQYIQTLKTQGENQGGLHVRSEFEDSLSAYKLDLALIKAPLKDILQNVNVADLKLEPMFSTNFTRNEIQLEGIEVVLDQGLVTYKELSDELCEIELELKANNESNQTESLDTQILRMFELAKTIAQDISVMPSDTSKALRGDRLKMIDQAQQYKVVFPKIKSQASIQEQTACHLQFIQSNWEAYGFSKQSSYLIIAIDGIKGLLDLIQSKAPKYYIKIHQALLDVSTKWQMLVANEMKFDQVQQDKSIGQTWLSISLWCHTKEIN